MSLISDFLTFIHQQIHLLESPFLQQALLVLITLILSGGAYVIARMIYALVRQRIKTLAALHPITAIIVDAPLISRFLQFVPMLLAGVIIPVLFCDNRTGAILMMLTRAWFSFFCAHTFAALMTVLYQICNWKRGVTASPQKGIFQVLALLGYLFATVAIVATLSGRDPTYILSGLTALSAVLMLIFKDSIMGLTAGVTLASNGMVKIGDWIVVPGANADGDVIDIALTTVRVQNFDKTITTIPAYDLICKPFTNWRGMVESGGRRIKRAIQIDLDSVRFADEAQLAKWQKIDLLKEYLGEKLREINAVNAGRPTAKDSIANTRCLTNLGTFRAYCLAYLRNHPGIHPNLTQMVRQLQPLERGIPLEIYCFTNTTDWGRYENIQSDLFDHLLAIMPEFGLTAFQVTSAAALRTVAQEAFEALPKSPLSNTSSIH